MKNDGVSKNLSTTKILASENEEASFSIGDVFLYRNDTLGPNGVSSNRLERENIDLSVSLAAH